MTHDGREVSNFILDFCDKNSRNISNLPLQKILYFCHAWTLIHFDKPLIKHSFEAWQHGPVLQYIYREFKKYGDKPIKSRALRLDLESGKKIIAKYHFENDLAIFLETVVDFYSQLRPADLVHLSHAKDSPWYECWNHAGSTNPGMRIDDKAIRLYYIRVPTPFSIQ